MNDDTQPTTPPADGGAEDYTTDELWRSLASLYATWGPAAPAHPLSEPELSEEDVYAGAMLGFSADQAAIMLRDPLGLEWLFRMWTSFARSHGEGVLPVRLRKRLDEEATAGGPQWHRVLLNKAFFGTDWLDPDVWADLRGSLPLEVDADVLALPDDLGQPDVALAAGGHERLGADQGHERAWDPADWPRHAGLLNLEGESHGRERAWDPADWPRRWRKGDVWVLARPHPDGVTLALDPGAHDGPFDVTLWWTDGASTSLRFQDVAPYQFCQYPGTIPVAPGHLPHQISLHVAQQPSR